MEENKQVVAEWKATNQERLNEIKSFNPELYSAINLALNYLNKSLTGEELPQEVEEVKVQPASNEGFWRIMTKKELVDKYENILDVNGWNLKGDMDWMHGKPIKELIQDDLTEEQIGNRLRDNIRIIITDKSKDPNGFSWRIYPDFVIFDTSNVVQTLQPALQKGFWRIMTEQEMVDKYGSINNIPKWNSTGKMNWMFGMPIKELIQDDLTEEQIGNKFRDNISILTDEKKDPNGRSWHIFPRYAVFDTSNVAQQPTQRNLSGWRLVTEEELKKKKFGDLGIPEHVWKQIYGKPIEDFYDFDSEIAESIQRLNSNENPKKFTKGIAGGYNVTDNYFVYEYPAESKIPAYRIVTKDEFDQRNLEYGIVSPKEWSEIYGKSIQDFYSTTQEVNDAINKLESGKDPNYITKGKLKGIMIAKRYWTYIGSESQTTSTGEWRFKTLDEIQKEGLGFAGTSEKLINRYASKKLKDIVNSVDFDRYLKNIKNQEGSIITSDGYSYPYKFFTDQPLPQETTTGFKLSIETLPATLKRDYIFTPNTGNRKAPSQSAGYLYSKYANLPAAQAELFSTFFKGNDGAWWKLKQVGTEWRWEKASPQPSQTATSTSGKNIDQMIREAAEKFAQNKTIANLPPYLKQLAINNQIKQSGVVRENISLSTGFSWVDSNEGKVFWSDVVGGGFLTQKVLSVIGSKEKLFEMPPKQSAEQPKVKTKQEWTPQDLVGKTLLFKSTGKKYLVEKFTRNNPKNKEYKLRDLTSPNTPEVTYRISMGFVKKWLDGQTVLNIMIIQETPTGSDYSTWTQAQLNQKRKEISDALIAFEEDDPEYKELKDQLDIIDTFID